MCPVDTLRLKIGYSGAVAILKEEKKIHTQSSFDSFMQATTKTYSFSKEHGIVSKKPNITYPNRTTDTATWAKEPPGMGERFQLAPWDHLSHSHTFLGPSLGARQGMNRWERYGIMNLGPWWFIGQAPVALAPEGAAPTGNPWLTSSGSSERAGFVSHGRNRLFTGAQEESDILAKNNSLTARVLPFPWKSSSSCTRATVLFQQQSEPCWQPRLAPLGCFCCWYYFCLCMYGHFCLIIQRKKQRGLEQSKRCMLQPACL